MIGCASPAGLSKKPDIAPVQASHKQERESVDKAGKHITKIKEVSKTEGDTIKSLKEDIARLLAMPDTKVK